jgi:hypothetical protein
MAVRKRLRLKSLRRRTVLNWSFINQINFHYGIEHLNYGATNSIAIPFKSGWFTISLNQAVYVSGNLHV